MIKWIKRLFFRDQATRLQANYDLVAKRKAEREAYDVPVVSKKLQAEQVKRAMNAPLTTIAGRPVSRPSVSKSELHRRTVQQAARREEETVDHLAAAVLGAAIATVGYETTTQRSDYSSGGGSFGGGGASGDWGGDGGGCSGD
jgi:hypothetical protein